MNGNGNHPRDEDEIWEQARPTKRVRILEPIQSDEDEASLPQQDYEYPEPPSPPRAYRDFGEVQYEENISPPHNEHVVQTAATSRPRRNRALDVSDDHFNERLDDDWFDSILAAGSAGASHDHDYTFTNDWNDSEDEDSSDGTYDQGEGRREARGERARGRGRGRPRGRPRGSRAATGSTRGPGRPRKDPSQRGAPAARTRRAPGSRREGTKGRPRGPRKQPEASPEVAVLLHKANAALISGDFEAALVSARDAVHLNPEIYQAHILTSEALDKLGRVEDAIDALQIAGSANNDPALLKDVARRIEEKNTDFQHDDRLKELYTKIVDRSKGRWDYHARRSRLEINLRKKHVGHTIGDCVEILAHQPLNTEVLQVLVEVGPRNKDYQRVADAYEEAFSAACAARNAGEHEEAAKFDMGLLNIYLDLLLEWKHYARGITTLRQMARWIMGREEEVFWDDEPDDREWDEDDYPRRQEVSSYIPGEHVQSAYDLPIELRTKLGLYRFFLDPPQPEEAARHFVSLTPDDRSTDAPVNEFPDLLQDVGKAYAGLKTEPGYWEALRFLRPLAEETPSGFDLTEVWSILAACYMSLHNLHKSVKSHLDDAEHAYVEYLKTGPEKSSARIKLVDIYLGQGREYEAQQHVFLVEDKKRYLLLRMQAQNLLNPQYVAVDDPTRASARRDWQAYRTNNTDESDTRDLQNTAMEATPAFSPAANQMDAAQKEAPQVYLTKTEALAEAARVREQFVRDDEERRRFERPQSQTIAPRPGSIPQEESQPEDEDIDAQPEKDRTEESAPGISHETPLAAMEQLGLDGKPRRYGRPKLKVTQRKRRNLLPPEIDAAALDRAQGTWESMCALEDRLEAEDSKAEQTWINLGAHLIEDFINEQRHFPNRDKHKQFTGYGGTGKWYQYDMTTETYRNIAFETWCDIFCKLAILQAKHHSKLRSGQSIPKSTGNDEQDEGDAGVVDDDTAHDKPLLLKHQRAITGYSMMASMRTIAYAANAHPFHHNEGQTFRIHATWLACALALQEEEYVQSECRYFAKAYPDQSDTFRLYSIASRLYPTKDRTWYNCGPNQKYLLRQIKAMDYSVLPPESRRLFKLSDQERRGISKNMKAKQQQQQHPSGLELDPVLLALYAHIIMAGGMLNNALYYYYRALALVPDDPVVLLCIANCYLVQGFKRLTANRTYYMQLGSAFLHRYHAVRAAPGCPRVHLQEAEFNLAHMWHLMGLVGLAVPHYEKVLELSAEVRAEHVAEGRAAVDEDFAPDAAFALSTIMATNGAAKRARELREKWLTI